MIRYSVSKIVCRGKTSLSVQSDLVLGVKMSERNKNYLTVEPPKSLRAYYSNNISNQDLTSKV